MSKTAIVYLIHFERPFKRASHYIGSALFLERRLNHHRAGTGARLLRAVQLAGIAWEVVRTWPGDKQTERKLKNRKNAPDLCPRCRELRKLAGKP